MQALVIISGLWKIGWILDHISCFRAPPKEEERKGKAIDDQKHTSQV